MNTFIDVAIQHGVKRFVIFTGSSVECGVAFNVGMVWKHLVDCGVEWCILRATWFMENLSQWQHITTIKSESKIYSARADGQVPFVSARDIATVAYHALINPDPPNTHYRVPGPALLTQDQRAEKLSKGLGRKIMHVKLSPEEVIQRWMRTGMPEPVAKFMTSLEVMTARGEKEMESDDAEKVTGKPPQPFDSWVQENKTAWD